MTNFLLKNPKAIFIHLPKTGGTSVREALGGDVQRRYFGHIPNSHRHLDSFAVVREPKARFLSAFRMFKYGNKLEKDYYSEPRWPDLTIAKALDVLQDPLVGFDRSQRSLSWNLKHHLIPQTHPFNCLFLAKTTLRFENLDADFSGLCLEMGISAELPRLRRSFGKQLPAEPWALEDIDRFENLFREDYTQLGYESETGPQSSAISPVSPHTQRSADLTVYSLWSAYFSDQVVLVNNAADSLPAVDCDLEPFTTEIIPGKQSTTWAGRSKNLIEHFHQLQPEFSGMSRLSHLLACTIVVLRREADCQQAQKLFWRILDERF